MHVSNIKEDGYLERRLLPTGFGCPLCPSFKTGHEGVIKRHLKNHIANAVHFQDNIICRCNLRCRVGGHFHCPFCDNTVIRKENMISHLTNCEETQPLTDRIAPSVCVEHSYFLAPPESSQTCDHSYIQTASPKTPTVATDFDQPTPATPPASTCSTTPAPTSATHPAFTSSTTPATTSATPPASTCSTTPAPTSATHPAFTSSTTPASTSDQPMTKEEGLPMPSTRTKCPQCPLILYKKNLGVHIKRKHTQHEDAPASSHLKSICIDQVNGIYAVRKTSHGFSVPVHVQRKTWGQQHHIQCELKDCRLYHVLAERSGLSPSTCHHVDSVDYCSGTATEEPLHHQVLEEMVENGLFGYSEVDVCKRRQREAEEAHVPLSVFLDFGGSQNQICFSIYEPGLYHYSPLGRVTVTHNIKKNTWHCPCAKAHTSCTHKYIAKWHLFQTHKDLFVTEQVTTTASQSAPRALERAVKYVFKSKKIPATLPEEATAQRALTEYSESLFPDETTCQLCPGRPTLEEATQVTDKARIVGMQGVIQNVSTHNKQCPKCKMVYRYQEWRDGLHNFNDHVILTLQLCLYLRHNLQNHVSVSRVISSLKSLLREDFPATNLIFQGYCHFEALSNTEYKYSCVDCGFYPPVVVMDVYRKGVVSFEVCELEQPDNEFHGEHNIVSFWESVQLHMISRGFFEVPSQNPFVVSPTYGNWAPWIGEETRKGNTVLNTEFEKVALQRSAGEPQLGDVTEEHLIHELLKQKLSTIQKLCKACNLDTKGSRMDLINRLRGEMKSRETYDKVLQSIWGASGGWSVIMCPHGIVYSVKFNLRAESPRDFADLLLSWKHLPNVCVYDFARGLVAHVNLRVPENPPFQPFDGRLADPTNENVEAACHHNFRVHLPWLLEKLQPPEPNGHPVTGSSNHYVLYDKFHQADTKDPQDALRMIHKVPELKATLNSQVAEQLFAWLQKNNYFLNNIGPSAHIFLMRNILEHRNNNQNEKLVKRQLRRDLQVQQLHSTSLSDSE